ncbi:MAG TPA: nucleotidyltransferase family protein [Pyrinomonadaceae bacterium]
MEDVAAVILAAGRSQRMGAFKPLLPFGKQTVIESCVEYLQKAGIENIVVVLGHRAEEVRARISHLNVVCVVNSDATSEMNASIAVGVRELPPTARATLIALADHPAVPPSVVSKLIAEWQKGASLVIPTWQNRGGHPVLVDMRYRSELQNLDPNRGLRALFDAHRDELKRVPVESPYVARDMDTWDDYAALYQEVFGEPPPDPPRE